jgi:uncharacterized Zn finger protein (UPF0148 family)
MGLLSKKVDLVCSVCGRPFKGKPLAQGNLAFCPDCAKKKVKREEAAERALKTASELQKSQMEIMKKIMRLEKKSGKSGLTADEKKELDMLKWGLKENAKRIGQLNAEAVGF